MSECPGLLELFHPEGVATSAAVIGAACPDRLRPVGAAPPWELVVLAPSSAEARSARWVREAVRRVNRSLAPGGLVYVLGGPRARVRVARALRRTGITPAEYVVHLPDAAASELLLPARCSAIRRAADLLLPAASYRRRAVRLAASLPGAVPLLAHTHPTVAILARRSGGGPLAAWLSEATGSPPRAVTAIQARWRADRTRAVLYLDGEPPASPAVVKLALRAGDANADMRQEALALASLGPAARSAGAGVPTGTLLERGSRCPALLLETLPGESAARALAQRPACVPAVLRRLGTWLEAWSRATCRPQILDAARLVTWILGPARRLAEQLDNPSYVGWLEERCNRVTGWTVPLVATHNDLTMANVLLGPDGRLGILDWEAASADGLPLRDFVYAAVDALAAGEGYRDRAAAWSRCFGSGAAAGVVGEVLGDLRRAVTVPDEFATIAFHACWLQHAEDERRKGAPGERLPFLECARRAAALRWHV